MKGLDGGRINIGSCSVGGAYRCLGDSIQYVKERKQFGKSLGEFQNIQFRLADMATELTAARLMIHAAADLLDAKVGWLFVTLRRAPAVPDVVPAPLPPNSCAHDHWPNVCLVFLWALPQDPRATQQAAMAKRFATDVGFQVCNLALQNAGGYGYLKVGWDVPHSAPSTLLR